MEQKEVVRLVKDKFTHRYEPEVDGGTVFLYIFDQKSVLKSNAVGHKVLKSLEKAKTVRQIRKNISEDFPNIEEERLKKDINKFLMDLEAKGLVHTGRQ